MPKRKDFTIQEKNILTAIGYIWNEYIKLEKQHPNEQNEFAAGIHTLQHLIAIRAVRRNFPKMFPVKKDK